MRRRGQESRESFEKLVRRSRRELLAYIARRARDAEEAADVLAETYLIAWRKAGRIPEGETAQLWLFGVARNVLRKSASRRRHEGELVERLAGEIRRMRLVANTADDETDDPLLTALASLPEQDREILTLTAWEGLTPRQIAVLMGSTANVVRVRLHRARSRLKRQLNPSEGAESQHQQACIAHAGEEQRHYAQ